MDSELLWVVITRGPLRGIHPIQEVLRYYERRFHTGMSICSSRMEAEFWFDYMRNIEYMDDVEKYGEPSWDEVNPPMSSSDHKSVSETEVNNSPELPKDDINGNQLRDKPPPHDNSIGPDYRI